MCGCSLPGGKGTVFSDKKLSWFGSCAREDEEHWTGSTAASPDTQEYIRVALTSSLTHGISCSSHLPAIALPVHTGFQSAFPAPRPVCLDAAS